jgi:hydroxypyruvate isomerase
MIKLAANLFTMYVDVDPLSRFEAARHSGFDAVEVFLVGSLPAVEVRSRLDELGIELVQIYADPGAFDAGDRGIAIFPERREEFRASIDEAIRYARLVNCTRINCLAGIGDPAEDPARYEATLIENLAWAANECATAGLSLLLEPISNQGPHFFVRHTAHARSVIEQVAAPNVQVLYDVYHAQMLEGNVTDTICSNLDVIGHIQIADVPGRHEPGTGEIRFPYLLERIDAAGYTGWIGLEYFPSGGSDALDWARPYLRGQDRSRDPGSPLGSPREDRP